MSTQAATFRYSSVPAPFGMVWFAAGPRGLVRIALASNEEDFTFEVAQRCGPCRRDDRGLADVRRALGAYFEGDPQPLAALDVDLSGLAPFHRRVLEALRRVPFAGLVSYGELARRAGKPGAARAVGQAMGANPLPILFPCHRVIAADGSIGGFGGGLGLKRALLAIEGVTLPFQTDGGTGKPSAARSVTRLARRSAPRASRSGAGRKAASSPASHSASNRSRPSPSRS